jgi:diguanylate cyclase (GGDEF)-like protein
VVELGRETAGTTMCLTVRYVRDKAGDEGVRRVLALAGEERSAAELEDECRWSTYEQKIALWEAAAIVLDDPIVSRHIGESALRHSVGASLRVLLRTLGSPGMLLSNIAKTAPKFSTVATMDAIEVGRSSAVVTYELHEPKQAHLLDCQCNIGLMSVIGPLFGMPPLWIEHSECQVEGAPRCRYEIRWSPRSRFRRVFGLRSGRAYLEEQLSAMSGQLESLESTAADLVADDDVEAVLGRIVARAGVAVRAPRYLLAVRASDGAPIRVHADGYASDAEALQVGRDLLEGTDSPHFANAMVIDVSSSRRTYGRLAAFFDSHTFFEAEHRLLSAYARSAAAALDAATALEAARQRGATAQALLDLAHSLSDVSSAPEVAQKLAEAMPAVVEAQAGLVFLWDSDEQCLAVHGRHGWPEHVHDRLGPLVLRPSEHPSVAAFISNPAPWLMRTDEVDESLREVAESFEVEATACVPIQHHGDFLGLALAGFADGTAPASQAHVLDRLVGVADQAATALRNASLLERVRRQALHDTLTGLANRALFEELVAVALARSSRDGTRPALLFVDLDRFKRINDSLGHDHGDRLLCEVSDRLGRALRAGDALARLGGDEFGVLLHDVDRPFAIQLAERIRSALTDPVYLDDQPVVVSASIGIAVYPEDGRTYDDLLRHADIAMYEAKERGRNTCREYQPGGSTVGRSRLALETDLRRALVDDQLALVFQPEIHLASDRVVAVEALVRWDHPVLSRLGPDRFLHTAEDAGLSLALDAWVLRTACRYAEAWRRQRPDLRLAVNVAAGNCARPELVNAVSVALRESGLDPAGLELEISSTTALNASADALEVIGAIRDMGVSLALDDFGTGYSLFGRLRGFSVERVKIDGSFVRASSDADSIIPAITTMCHGLGLEVAAVGVETAAQLALVHRHGCDVVQGFLLGAPVDPAEVPSLLDARPLAALGPSAVTQPA